MDGMTWLKGKKVSIPLLFTYIVTGESNRFFPSFIVVVDRMRVNRIMDCEVGLRNLQVYIFFLFLYSGSIGLLNLWIYRRGNEISMKNFS